MTDIYANFPNSELPLSEEYEDLFAAFARTGLTSTDLLLMEPTDIARSCNRSVVEIRKFLVRMERDIRASFASGPETAEDLLKRQHDVINIDVPAADMNSSCSESNFILNDVIGGPAYRGIPLCTVSEIVGASSVGKSHLLMQLAITVQLRYKKRTAIYISTEGGGLETRRLQDIVKRVLSQCNARGYMVKGRKISTDNVHTFTCFEGEELLHVLKYQVPVVIDRYDVGLVIIDSIAAHFRGMGKRNSHQNEGDNNKQNWSRPTHEEGSYQLLRSITTCLKDLARTKQIAVVVANQVADRFWKRFNYSSEFAPSENNPHASDFKNSLSSFAISSRGIEALMADHQVRWYSGWTNICLMAQGAPTSHFEPSKNLPLLLQNNMSTPKLPTPQPINATRISSASEVLRNSLQESEEQCSDPQKSTLGRSETILTEEDKFCFVPAKKNYATTAEEMRFKQSFVHMSMEEQFEDFDGEEGLIACTVAASQSDDEEKDYGKSSNDEKDKTDDEKDKTDDEKDKTDDEKDKTDDEKDKTDDEKDDGEKDNGEKINNGKDKIDEKADFAHGASSSLKTSLKDTILKIETTVVNKKDSINTMDEETKTPTSSPREDESLGMVFTQTSPTNDTPKIKRRRILSAQSSEQTDEFPMNLKAGRMPSYAPFIESAGDDGNSDSLNTETGSQSDSSPMGPPLGLSSYFNASDPNVHTHNTGKVPALGLFWANQIDQRIVLKKAPDGRRYLQVVFSSWTDGNRLVEEAEADEMLFNPSIKDDDDDAFLDDNPDPFVTLNPMIPVDPSIDPTKDVIEFEIYSGGIRAKK